MKRWQWYEDEKPPIHPSKEGVVTLPGCPIAEVLSNDLKTGSQSEPLLATCANKHTDIQSTHAISRQLAHDYLDGGMRKITKKAAARRSAAAASAAALLKNDKNGLPKDPFQ